MAKKSNRPPPSNLETGKMFLHCAKCLKEKPPGVSPREHARFSVGWTKVGLQVWCIRHEVNVCHIDFEGMQHPANTTSYEPETLADNQQTTTQE